ncbi:tetratricopeptide repeat protein [Haliangium sp.]|uniref:tetratricopeptide repeat protein n=1 Tax=Haliangium sp. TaxID=2663208 RepID=UPI003D0C8699
MSRLRPETGETWRTLLRQGLEHQRAGHFDTAERYFARAHAMAPERPEVCYALGRARLRAGAAGEAESLLRAAWQHDRTLVSAAGNLARCLGLHGDRFEAAHAVLDDAEEAHGPLALLYVVRGELLLAEDRLSEAEEAGGEALRTAGTASEQEAARSVLARAANREGILHADGGEHERALFSFRRAAHLDPEWAGPQVNQGVAFARLGMRGHALTAYTRALELDPQSALAYENRGRLRCESGQLDAAHDDLARALRIDPGSRGAAVTLAAVHRARGDTHAAERVLSDAVESAPDDAELWFELGCALAATETFDGAELCWRRTLQLEPEHAGARAHLSRLLAQSGRLNELDRPPLPSPGGPTEPRPPSQPVPDGARH